MCDNFSKMFVVSLTLCILYLTSANKICEQDSDRGPCTDYSIRWFFDSSSDVQECKRFWYGGCQGNDNNFESNEDCQKACLKKEDDEEHEDQGHRARESCENSEFGCCEDKVTHSRGKNKEGCPETAQPEPIIDEAGGADGDSEDNKAEAVAEAEVTDEVKEEAVQQNSENICRLTSERGDCSNFTIAWFYDYNEGICKRFWYGGCNGNKNRFADQKDCEDTCVNNVGETTRIEDKTVVEETNVEDKTVEEETKVEGNTNVETGNEETDICKLPKDVGPCRTATRRWYFSQDDSQCTMFTYGGCDGNKNNFESKTACIRKCDPNSVVEETEVEEKTTVEVTEGETDICKLPSDVGPCRTATGRWYFNHAESECKMFTYGGCDGNENNFETKDGCLRKCDPASIVVEETGVADKTEGETTDEELHACEQPRDVGPCRNATVRWYFNFENDRCERFTFGGCDGNENNFETEMDCMKRCDPDSIVETKEEDKTAVVTADGETDVCKLPRDVGPCRTATRRWFFDHTKNQCARFTYGGCDGNKNNFETEMDCRKRCDPGSVVVEETEVEDKTKEETTSEELPVCEQPRDVGPCRNATARWYFNSENDRCERFTFGGCDGNENNFETEMDCMKRCDPGSIVVEEAEVEDKTKEETTFEELPVCEQPRDVGPCRNATARWYFNSENDRCERFTFGGCDGNENNFETEMDCMKRCDPGSIVVEEAEVEDKTKEETTFEELPVCEQPRDVGPCRNATARWYFNSENDRCERFTFGGCDGNENNFETEMDCMKSCDPGSIVVEETEVEDKAKEETTSEELPVCEQPRDVGPCRNATARWYFNSENDRCERFTFGGCDGNENNFETEMDCMKRCDPGSIVVEEAEVEDKTKEETTFEELPVCEQPRDVGPCRNATARWYFNSENDRCERFTFGGCDGNENNFETEMDCMKRCDPGSIVVEETEVEDKTKEETTVEELPVCEQPRDVGPCRNATARWYFNSGNDRCERFTFGGCDGNENNFETEMECMKRCDPGSIVVEETDMEDKMKKKTHEKIHMCKQPRDVGPCRNATARWYFNYENRNCERFTFGGCEGNENNFLTEMDCRKRCDPHSIVEEKEVVEETDTCKMSPDVGPCRTATPRWYFNFENQRCERFTYGGCDGNENNFETENSCLERCDPKATVEETDVCKLASAVGHCRVATARWYFNHNNQRCERFTYGGCGGNKNNFMSERDCLMRCHRRAVVDEETGVKEETAVEETGVCKLTKDVGPCRTAALRWYFNQETLKCEQFTYGGCDGNANNFEAQIDCLRQCDPSSLETDTLTTVSILSVCATFSEIDTCKQPASSGMCLAYMPSWHYNSTSQRCEMFIYGGCGGNENRFDSESDCLRKCDSEKLGPCDSPKVVGRCRAAIPSWFYNSETGACERFLYGGCGGNANRFETKANCERHCTDICHFPKAVGPCDSKVTSWYYDTETSRCEQFYYGGCEGNPNRFLSFELCEDKCPARSGGGDVRSLCEASTYGCCPDGRTAAEGPNKEGCCKTSQFGCCPDGLTPATGINEAGCEDLAEGSGDVTVCEFSEFGCCSDGVTAAKGDGGKGCPAITRPIGSRCDLEKETGPCGNYTIQWFYDMDSKECGRFWYGGCEGNTNRFDSKEECDEVCKDRVIIEPTLPVCQQPVETGPCNDVQTRWYSDPKLGLCLEFNYGGCEGNDNNFDSLESCYNTCGVPVCEQPKTVGPCRASIPRYYFDKSSGKCETFLFGGCDGNHNNFETEEICVNTCMEGEVEVVEHKTDLCLLPQVVGRCRARKARWFFDSASGQCAEFIYGGCGGNENNFLTREECEQSCQHHIKTGVLPVDPEGEVDLEKNGHIKEKCKYPSDTGLCLAYFQRWFYDYASEECRQFIYGGCGGNDNNFKTEEECKQECGTPTDVVINGAAVCHLRKEIGNCEASVPSWFYNHEEGECQEFTYGGCGGNGNNFKTRQDCENTCSWAAVCQQPQKTGTCYASLPRFYYNPTTRECDEFIYGGCGGNANNFASFEQCNRKCVHAGVTDRKRYNIHADCKVPVQKGDCNEYLVRWYYDLSIDDCRRFVYTGCGGNVNQFDSRDDCRTRCIKSNAGLIPDNESGRESEITVITTAAPVTSVVLEFDICDEKADRGGCGNWSIYWYYNKDTEICDRFYYGGCDGNANRFETEAECVKICIDRRAAPTTTTTTPTTTTEERRVGPSCRHSAYGCCPGSSIPAVDFHQSNCDDNIIVPDDTSDAYIVKTKAGRNVTLACPGQDGHVNVGWYREGFLLSSSEKRNILENRTLVLHEINTEDAGIYACRVSRGNELPFVQRYKIVILEPIELMPGPAKIEVKPGHNAFLHCHAVGNPPPRIHWKRGDYPVRSNGRHRVFPNGTLIIYMTEESDVGVYTCEARNSDSPPEHRSMELYLREQLYVKISAHEGHYQKGSTVTLSCMYGGFPAPTSSWKKDGEELESSDNVAVTDRQVVIKDATYEDTGAYSCVAKNTNEEAEAATSVQIIPITVREDECVDKMRKRKCQIIKAARLCGYTMFRKMCCKTCEKFKE